MRLPLQLSVHYVGKARAGPLDPALRHYEDRIARVCRLDIRAHPTAETPLREARRLQDALGKAPFIALHPAGAAIDSEGFVAILRQGLARADQALRFVIGGARGLHASMLDAADRQMTLSALTLSHDLARLLLLEQLYRGLSTITGSPYAK